ncbi:MAG: patatin-like phospholipase family protein [Verrucomicrobiota bacterium]|nr:patatin-like phospholipase family protein [Verrucomicrobiota bacterium]
MTKPCLFSILAAASLLASPRAEEERPKIGLVLGGGGALGLAHVGVLQELEKLQIPIDYIGGTSMGAVVAGMYASGMAPDEMERRFLALDWWDVLKDRSSYQYLDYRRKLDDKRFMGMEFGLKKGKIAFPPGMAYGQKLNNVLETFSINSAGISDFDQLNIPYRAVATDLRSGTSVVLKSGNLALAMRASMAVPGAFTPVRMDGMVLVDGGILKNIPIDVVKGMGADIIIAVDVGAASAGKGAEADFRSLGEVVSRTYSLMQRPSQEKQLAHADFVIAPDLSGISSSQFHLVATIIPVGREAAQQLRTQLAAYGVADAAFQAFLKKQRRQHSEEIVISDIAITGNHAVSETVIRDRIKTKEEPLQLNTIFEDLNRIHGMGDFQTVAYDLAPTNGSYRLEYNTTEKFWGPSYLRFGTKVEITTGATALWSLLLNYTRTQLNPLGGEVQINLEGGGRKRHIEGEWYQPVSWGEHAFLAPAFTYSGEDIDLYNGNTDVADIEQTFAYGTFDAGASFFEYGELRIGLLGGHAKVDGNSGFFPIDKISDTVVATTTHLRLDQLDDPIFPSKGYQLSLDGLFAFEEMGSSETFSKLEAQLITPFTIGPHTIIPRLVGGSSLGTELPFYAWFDVGGLDSFAGYAPYQLRGNYYGVGSLGYRYELGQLPPTLGNGLFAMARIDAGNAWFSGADVRAENLEYGSLIGLGADTIVGACQLAVGKAESTNPRFYFSIGNAF